MENQSDGRQRTVWLPGFVSNSNVCVNELMCNRSGDDAASSDKASPEYCGKDVTRTPVQESLGRNTSNAEEDKSPLSPISEQGQKGREFFQKGTRSNGSMGNDHKDEYDDTPNQINDKNREEETGRLADNASKEKKSASVADQQIPGTLSNNQSQASTSVINSDVRSNNSTNLGISEAQGNFFCLRSFVNSSNNDSSFVISSTGLSIDDYIKMVLSSNVSASSNSGSEGWLHGQHLLMEELLRAKPNLQDGPMNCTNLTDTESVKALINSFKKNLIHIEGDIPSFRSYCLLKNAGMSTFDPSHSSLLTIGLSLNSEMKVKPEAQCFQANCSKALCLKFQECMVKLKDHAVGLEELSDEEESVLRHMYHHCCSCKHLRCPLYWCRKAAVDWPMNPKTILFNMKQLVEHGYHGNFLEEIKSGFFSKEFPNDDLPEEGKDWHGMCRLTGANNSILAVSNLDRPYQYWILKKNPMFKSQSQIQLYEKLGQLSHRGITEHLWTAFCPKTLYMVVCSPFAEFSLHESLQKSPIKNHRHVVKLMLQVLHAVRYLHDHGILYLNWSSKNILYDNLEQLRLSNFTCSALKSRLNVDIGDVTASLPRHLFTPEMLARPPVIGDITDIWGIGCLLKEIFTAQPVWYEYHHETDQELHKKILERRPTEPDDCLEFYNVFRACWEKDPRQRPNLEELKNMLHERSSR